MRIIGGKFKKKKLISVQGLNTRPTSDRLRETLFNIISHRVLDAAVLDLFAGTGAFGIEALSRGASTAFFVERHPEAVTVIKKNIAACSFEKSSGVSRWDVSKNLNCLKGKGPFGLVFMDPPYEKGLIPVALNHLKKSLSLKEQAILIAEHSVSEEIDSLPEGFSITDQRVYGKTTVSFLVYEKAESDML